MPPCLQQQPLWPTVEQPSFVSSCPLSLSPFFPSSPFLPPIGMTSIPNAAHMPNVTVGDAVPSLSLHHRTPLHLSSLPLSTTFGLFQTSVNSMYQQCPSTRYFALYSISAYSHTLLDPTAEEERVCTGQVTVVTLSSGKLSTVCKTGRNRLCSTLNHLIPPPHHSQDIPPPTHTLTSPNTCTHTQGNPSLSAEALLELCHVAQQHASTLAQLVKTALN